MTDRDLVPLLHRVADALERLAPARAPVNDIDAADAFVWHAEREWLEPVASVNRVPIGLLRGIDRVRDILLENTERFAAGLPANNVLLWGARGTGKSALVKAAHAAINEARPGVRQGPLPLILRRSVVRPERHQLQIAEGRARGRDRGTARQRRALRDLEPSPPDGARDDRERTLDRDQPGGGGRGEGVAVRPVRFVARLPPPRPGDLSGDRARLCRALRSRSAARPAQRRSQRVVDHPRLALGPGRMAVHPGPRRAARQTARVRKPPPQPSPASRGGGRPMRAPSLACGGGLGWGLC